ncbi:MAG: hypothetical protein P8J27_05615 [Mariniblastus sp.]|nr:hypothetical protein [Mariniblastus sp.]
MAKSKRTSGQLGCGFILLSGIRLIVLLVANVLFVRAFFSANLSGLDDRVFQAAQFVLPIIMIFIEFWLYDLVFTRGKIPHEKNRKN